MYTEHAHRLSSSAYLPESHNLIYSSINLSKDACTNILHGSLENFVLFVSAVKLNRVFPGVELPTDPRHVHTYLDICQTKYRFSSCWTQNESRSIPHSGDRTRPVSVGLLGTD